MSPLLIGVIVAAIMVVGADVLVPLALAGLLSFALAGPVRALQRVGFPRPVAVVAVVVFAFAVIFGLGEMLASEVGELSDDLPRYEAAIQDKIEGLRREGRSAVPLDRAQGVLKGPLERAQRALRDFGREISVESRKTDEQASGDGSFPADRRLVAGLGHGLVGAPLGALVGIIGPVLDPLVRVSLAFVFVVFILIQREDLRMFTELGQSPWLTRRAASLARSGRPDALRLVGANDPTGARRRPRRSLRSGRATPSTTRRASPSRR